MDFPQSRAVAADLEYLPETPSTNDELIRRAKGASAVALPDLSVVVTDNQTAGRGRLGRVWVSPAGKSLAVSVLLRGVDATGASVPVERFGWFPLMAGLAMSRAVAAAVPAAVALKWPNDVLIDGKKVCGILSELIPGNAGVVVGAGVNVSLEEDELPTDWSTSLLLAGAKAPDADALLAAYLTELFAGYADFLGDGAGVGVDPTASLRTAVTDACDTIGRRVKVELPSSDSIVGVATGIDAAGRLLVETNTGIATVAAGDVTHLRY